MDPNRLTRKMFSYEKTINGKWYQNLVNICENINAMELRTECNPINIESARNKLIETFTDVWVEQCNKTSKLQNLVKIHNNLSVSGHVNTNLIKFKKSLISWIECGVLGLRVETVRYQGLSRGDRKCQICNQKQIGDELHFLFECNKHQVHRLELYNKLPEILNEVEKSNVLKDLFNILIYLEIILKNCGTNATITLKLYLS